MLSNNICNYTENSTKVIGHPFWIKDTTTGKMVKFTLVSLMSGKDKICSLECSLLVNIALHNNRKSSHALQM